jgi:hypothetical protein
VPILCVCLFIHPPLLSLGSLYQGQKCIKRSVPHKRVRFAVHINDLPLEILGELFSHLSNEHPLHLRHSLFTCKRWYQVAMYHPAIWTTIAIDELYFDFFMDRPIEAGRSLVRACLERSGKHPLRLFVHCPEILYESRRLLNTAPPHPSAASTYLREALGIIAENHGVHFLRLGSLEWTFVREALELPLIAQVFPQKLRRLHSLTINNFMLQKYRSTDSSDTFPWCPQLSKLRLSDHNEGVKYFPIAEFAQVTTLEYHDSFTWLRKDLDYLRRFINLRNLTLETGNNQGWTHTDLPRQVTNPLLLPLLRRITLIGSIPRHFLMHFEAPTLHSVRVEADACGQDSLLNFRGTRLCGSMRTLKVVLEGEAWILDLQAVLQKASSIESVVLRSKEQVQYAISVLPKLNIAWWHL